MRTLHLRAAASRVSTSALVCLVLAATTPGQGPPGDRPVDSITALDGRWEGAAWGRVTIRNGRGTYTDTFGTGPGTFRIRATGTNRFEGVWGESDRRFGTMAFSLSADGRTVTGTWSASPRCEISAGFPTGASLAWRRRDEPSLAEIQARCAVLARRIEAVRKQLGKLAARAKRHTAAPGEIPPAREGPGGADSQADRAPADRLRALERRRIAHIMNAHLAREERVRDLDASYAERIARAETAEARQALRQKLAAEVARCDAQLVDTVERYDRVYREAVAAAKGPAGGDPGPAEGTPAAGTAPEAGEWRLALPEWALPPKVETVKDARRALHLLATLPREVQAKDSEARVVVAAAEGLENLMAAQAEMQAAVGVLRGPGHAARPERCVRALNHSLRAQTRLAEHAPLDASTLDRMAEGVGTINKVVGGPLQLDAELLGSQTRGTMAGYLDTADRVLGGAQASASLWEKGTIDPHSPGDVQSLFHCVYADVQGPGPWAMFDEVTASSTRNMAVQADFIGCMGDHIANQTAESEARLLAQAGRVEDELKDLPRALARGLCREAKFLEPLLAFLFDLDD